MQLYLYRQNVFTTINTLNYTLCQNLSKENKGKCGWGECKKCGVLPLLHKLHNGILVEDPKEIKELRDQVFNNSK